VDPTRLIGAAAESYGRIFFLGLCRIECNFYVRRYLHGDTIPAVSIQETQRDLAEALRGFAERADGANAFVFDAWGLIWCSAWLTFGDDQVLLYAQVRHALESPNPPLQRGGKLDGRVCPGSPPMYCVSFASCYVLGVWISEPLNPLLLRRAVKEALLTIEPMTLSLPPPDGTGGFSGAQHA